MKKILYALFLAATSVFAESVEVIEAWRYVNETPLDAHGDLMTREEGRQAVKVLRENREEVRRLVTAALVKGAERGRAESVAGLVFDRHEFLAIAREAIRTYDFATDKDIPFVGYFTAVGDKDDMEFIKKLIARAPDSERATQQAELMATVDNPNARTALLELAKEAPGRWLEAFHVKKAIGNRTIESAPAIDPLRVETDAPRATSTANQQIQPPRVHPISSYKKPVTIVIGLSAVIVGIMLFLKRRNATKK